MQICPKCGTLLTEEKTLKTLIVYCPNCDFQEEYKR